MEGENRVTLLGAPDDGGMLFSSRFDPAFRYSVAG